MGADSEADRQAEILHELFGDRLYVEICDHGTEGPVSLRDANIALARPPLKLATGGNQLGALCRGNGCSGA